MSESEKKPKSEPIGPHDPRGEEAKEPPKAAANPVLEKLAANAAASTPAQRAQMALLPDLEPEHFEDFKRDVADMAAGGGSANLQRLVKIWGSSFPNLYHLWLSEKQRPVHEARQAEKARNSVQVRAFKEGTPQQTKTVSKDEAAAWVKPGHVVVEKSPNIAGRGFDTTAGASFGIRTHAVGDEIPEGTVKAKRMVKHHGGEWTVEYLVKPKAGGKQPSVAQKIKDAERDLSMNAEYMSPEQRAEARAKLDAMRAGK